MEETNRSPHFSTGNNLQVSSLNQSLYERKSAIESVMQTKFSGTAASKSQLVVWLLDVLLTKLGDQLDILQCAKPFVDNICHDDQAVEHLDEREEFEDDFIRILDRRKINLQGHLSKKLELEKIKKTLGDIHQLDNALYEKIGSPQKLKKKQLQLVKKRRREIRQIFSILKRTAGELEQEGEPTSINDVLRENGEEQNQYNELTARLSRHLDDIKDLREDILTTKEKSKCEHELAEERIEVLTGDIKRAKLFLEINQPTKFKNQDAAISSIKRTQSQIEATAERELNAIRLQHQQIQKSFSNVEIYLKARNENAQDDLQAWNEKMKTNVPEMKTRLDEITEKRKNTFETLTKSTEQFKNETLMKEKRRMDALEKIATAHRRNRAAIRIQKFVRAFLQRLKDNPKKKKGKNKKKNKKKKKK